MRIVLSVWTRVMFPPTVDGARQVRAQIDRVINPLRPHIKTKSTSFVSIKT